MAENKTVPTDASVTDFLDGVSDEKRRRDCYTVLEIMRKITGLEPRMWGPGMVGFGQIHYKYASGREGDTFLTGFSPRKQDLTLYINGGLERFEETLKTLGKYKTGKVCLYLKKLDDVDLQVLQELITQSVEYQRNHP